MELVGGIPEVLCGCGGRWLLQKKMFASVMDFNLSLGASKAEPVSVECSEDEFLLRSCQLLQRFR